MRQEIAFLRIQHHPGIVRVFEDGVVDGDPWYAMELLEGRTLEDFNDNLWAVAPDRATRSRIPSESRRGRQTTAVAAGAA